MSNCIACGDPVNDDRRLCVECRVDLGAAYLAASTRPIELTEDDVKWLKARLQLP